MVIKYSSQNPLAVLSQKKKEKKEILEENTSSYSKDSDRMHGHFAVSVPPTLISGIGTIPHYHYHPSRKAGLSGHFVPGKARA